jgi:type II secretory pathway predicted ATPase ExeA
LKKTFVPEINPRVTSHEDLGLLRKPFALTPDPAFYFASRGHGRALEQILSHLSGPGSLALVFGDVGNGKTILSRKLFELVDPAAFDTCLIFNPITTDNEFVADILQRLEVKTTNPGDFPEALCALRNHFARSTRGKRILIGIDEAQAFSDDMLRFIARLVSASKGNPSYVHLVLFGQLEIVRRILQPTMQEVRTAISLTCFLQPLTSEETGNYVSHRLAKAGSNGSIRFTQKAVSLLYEASHGCPRILNTLCDRSLIVLHSRPRKVVDYRIAKWVLENNEFSDSRIKKL